MQAIDIFITWKESKRSIDRIENGKCTNYTSHRSHLVGMSTHTISCFDSPCLCQYLLLLLQYQFHCSHWIEMINHGDCVWRWHSLFHLSKALLMKELKLFPKLVGRIAKTSKLTLTIFFYAIVLFFVKAL